MSEEPRAMPPHLTARGEATRERMVRAAADLLRVKGVGATSVGDVLRASATSKSQFYRYFGDKDSLVAAAVSLQTDVFLATQLATLRNVRNFRGLRRWRDAMVQSSSLRSGAYGCVIGSLALEISSSNEHARVILDRAFVRWQELIEDAMVRMQAAGSLSRAVDASGLALGLIAAVEGGYLLGQAAHSSAPVATSIDVALDRVEGLLAAPL